MRLRLEAEPEELAAKGGHLLEALAESLGAHAPELADALHKAVLDSPAVPLKHPVLQALQERTRALYLRQMDAMVADIGNVLDRYPV